MADKKPIKKQEFILDRAGCIDILSQLLSNYGNKTIRELIDSYVKDAQTFELAISEKNLKKLDEILANITDAKKENGSTRTD